MAQNRGKQWETKIREDFSNMSGAYIYRVPDSMNGFKGLTGISDFIGYCFPKIFFLEAKTILGNTFPFSNFSQFDKLMSIPCVKGVHRGVLIWFQDHDKAIYVPVTTVEKMKQDGKKSVNIRTIDEDGYDYIVIPSIKKRVFLDCDYSVLLNLPDTGW